MIGLEGYELMLDRTSNAVRGRYPVVILYNQNGKVCQKLSGVSLSPKEWDAKRNEPLEGIAQYEQVVRQILMSSMSLSYSGLIEVPEEPTFEEFREDQIKGEAVPKDKEKQDCSPTLHWNPNEPVWIQGVVFSSDFTSSVRLGNCHYQPSSGFCDWKQASPITPVKPASDTSAQLEPKRPRSKPIKKQVTQPKDSSAYWTIDAGLKKKKQVVDSSLKMLDQPRIYPVLWTSRTLADGSHPILIQYNYKSVRKYKGVGIKLRKKQWCEDRARPVPSTPDYEAIMAAIDRTMREFQKEMEATTAELRARRSG